MKKRNKLLIKLGILCTAFVGLITALVVPTYAYSLDSNGNIQSSNLIDYTHILNYESANSNNPSSYYSYSDGVLRSTHNSWYENLGFKINLSPNTTSTISRIRICTNSISSIRR